MKDEVQTQFYISAVSLRNHWGNTMTDMYLIIFVFLSYIFFSTYAISYAEIMHSSGIVTK